MALQIVFGDVGGDGLERNSPAALEMEPLECGASLDNGLCPSVRDPVTIVGTETEEGRAARAERLEGSVCNS